MTRLRRKPFGYETPGYDRLVTKAVWLKLPEPTAPPCQATDHRASTLEVQALPDSLECKTKVIVTAMMKDRGKDSGTKRQRLSWFQTTVLGVKTKTTMMNFLPATTRIGCTTQLALDTNPRNSRGPHMHR